MTVELEWPAKLARLADQQPGTDAHTETTAQQLPFLRPIGYDLAPKVADDLCEAIGNAHKPHLDGKKF